MRRGETFAAPSLRATLAVDPGARPTVKQMMAEIDAAPAWSRGTAWAKIREGVSSYSGAEQLERWDQHGAWNGVD